AISKIFGLRAPPNGYLCKNVILGTEVLLSHLGHFYLCFAPDLAHPTYRALPFYKEIKKRFSPFSGISYRKFIQARKNLLVVLGLFAGKWPNTLSIHPGGTTKTINKSEIKRCLATLKEFQDFVEDVLLGCEIERWLEIKKVKEMEKWCNEKKEKQGDLALFVSFSKKANLHRLGKTPGKLLCFKGYEDQQGLWYKDGYYEKGVFHSLDTSKITEEKSFSWLEGEENHPFDDFTRPSPGKKGAYSWSKSPRYKGEAVEVGPLSRLVINREPLISDVFKDSGSNVYSRMLARLQEVVLLTRKINEWIKKINPEKPFYQKPKNVKNRKGEGIVEAPRGALGHWIQVEGDGK
ncbi:nickel-dependent hydrogenase large subunit, partial [Candidatus Aerophobetes bacterium]|nr:nickel-dependent hydrogenase large subunit [Candidatus Aerophobetes bacterium]